MSFGVALGKMSGRLRDVEDLLIEPGIVLVRRSAWRGAPFLDSITAAPKAVSTRLVERTFSILLLPPHSKLPILRGVRGGRRIGEFVFELDERMEISVGVDSFRMLILEGLQDAVLNGRKACMRLAIRP